MRHATLPAHPVGDELGEPLDLVALAAAADRRLASAVVRLREPSETNGFVNGHPMAYHRWLPSVEPGKGLALDELIATSGASFEGGQAWAGKAEIDLFDVPTEELADPTAEEVIGGYYRQVGVNWNGGTLLETGTSGAE
ncbi:acetoacetate decarboxylase family protein [Microbispora sitophila]|uniref:acetoacetate decarboxylase family protein n=1 Tax=Microbispora sitophila TaxID=2771537 RepID=UPI001D005C5C|nr:acetoacetate decarboxylase family protein [Microbispora sitophila]